MSKSATMIIPQNEEDIQTPQGSPPDIVSIQKNDLSFFLKRKKIMTFLFLKNTTINR